MGENIANTITDLKNGLYRVEYTAPKAGRYKLSIGLVEEGVSTNIRGSPIDIQCDGDDPANNNIDGPAMMNKFLKENFELIESQMETLIKDSKTKGKDLSNINTIISIKNSNKTIDLESDKIDCTINQLVEYYKTFEIGKTKIAKEIPLDKLEGMFKTLNQMLDIRENSGNEIAPLIIDQTDKNKTEIQEFSRTLITYGSQIRLREFAQRYDIGPKKAFEEIAKVELEVQERQAKLDVYDTIMKNLNLPDETNSCHKTLDNTRSDMRIIKNMWKFIQETLALFEDFKGTNWPNINGPAMDEKCGQSLTKKLTTVRKEANSYGTIIECINKEINLWKKLIPLISSMKADCIKDRHWDEIKSIINKKDLKIDKNLNIKLFYDLNIHLNNEEIGEITEKAAK